VEQLSQHATGDTVNFLQPELYFSSHTVNLNLENTGAHEDNGYYSSSSSSESDLDLDTKVSLSSRQLNLNDSKPSIEQYVNSSAGHSSSLQNAQAKQTQTEISLPHSQYITVNFVAEQLTSPRNVNAPPLPHARTPSVVGLSHASPVFSSINSPHQNVNNAMSTFPRELTPRDSNPTPFFQNSPGFSPIPYYREYLQKVAKDTRKVDEGSGDSPRGKNKHHVHWASSVQELPPKPRLNDGDGTLHDVTATSDCEWDDVSLQSISLLKDVSITSENNSIPGSFSSQMLNTGKKIEYFLSSENPTDLKFDQSQTPQQPTEQLSSGRVEHLTETPGAVQDSQTHLMPLSSMSVMHTPKKTWLRGDSKEPFSDTRFRGSRFWRDRLEMRYMTSVLGSPKIDKIL